MKLKLKDEDIVKILEHYSINNIRIIGDEVSFSCPFPEHPFGDRNPSSSINTKGFWHCFGCGRSGTIVNLISELENIPEAVAYRWLTDSLSEKLQLHYSAREYLAKPKEKDVENIIPDEFLSNFKVDWDKVEKFYDSGYRGILSYPFKRGLRKEILKEFNIGYDTKSERLIFPIKNSSGKLVGFKGRATSSKDKPKYKSIGDKTSTYYGFPNCKIHNYVYGLYNANSDVIIVEGEIDVLWLRQNGINAIGLGGSVFSEKQKQAILSHCTSATLLLDRDSAGEKVERKILKNLVTYMPVRVARLEKGDPAGNTKNDIKNAIQNTEYKLKELIKK